MIRDMVQAYVGKSWLHGNGINYILRFSYNRSKHTSTRYSRFMLMYGFQPWDTIYVTWEHTKCFKGYTNNIA